MFKVLGWSALALALIFWALYFVDRQTWALLVMGLVCPQDRC